MEKVVNEGSQWVKDMQQMSKRYETNETARTKGTFKNKATNKNKFIFYNNKTYIDT